MINKPAQTSGLGCVHDCVLVNTKHITASDSLRVIALFAMISNRLTNRLAHVLDHKLLGPDLLQREQTPVVNAGLGKF